MAKKKKRGLGSLLREQVEETPVVRQSAPTASAPVNNGGGIGSNFRSAVKQETATQKAERERSQRMRQGLSTIARSTFKMQAQNPLAPTKTGGQGVGNYGFKSHVRQILAPVKQDIRENPYDAVRKIGMKGSVNERKIYRPLSERDENGQVSTNQRRLENAARGGNRKAQVEAEMGRTKAKTVGGRTYDQFINAELNKKGLMGQDYILRSKDPSQEALDYRKQYGFDEEARQMVNDMADSPFKLGLGESYRARDVEDTLRRQYGVDLNEEEQARLNEARDSMAYMGGNVLGQASQFALTAPLSPLVEEGLMARAGLQGGRAAITTARDALKYAGARIGADQIVSAPINLLDALKEDNGADIIKRFGMNTAMDIAFGGLMEFPAFMKNLHFVRGLELNNEANAVQDVEKKLVGKIGAQRELSQAIEEAGDTARREILDADEVARRYTNLQEYGSVDEPTEDIVMQMRRGARDLDSPAIADDGAEAGERFAELRNRTDGSEIPKQRNRVYGNIQEATAREAAEDTAEDVAESVAVKDSERSLESLLNELEEIEDNAYRLGIDEPPRADEIDAELRRRGINLWETDEGELQRLIDEDNLARQTPEPAEPKAESPAEKTEPKEAEKVEEPNEKVETSTEKVETSAEKVEQPKEEPKQKEEPKVEAKPKEPKKETKPKKEKKPKLEPKDWKRVESGYKNKDTATLNKNREKVLKDVAKGNITKAEADRRLELIDNAIASKKPRDLELEAKKNREAEGWGDPDTPKKKRGAPQQVNGEDISNATDTMLSEGQSVFSKETREAGRKKVLEEGGGRVNKKPFDKDLRNAEARYNSNPQSFMESLVEDATERVAKGKLPKSRDSFVDYIDDAEFLVKRNEKVMKDLDKESEMYQRLLKENADIQEALIQSGSQGGQILRRYQAFADSSEMVKDEIINRNLANLEEEFKKRLDKVGVEELKFPDELRDAIKSAKTGEEAAEAWEKASIYVWNQIPASMKDKIDFIRINAMLLNPTTHIRNFLGNAMFVPLREMKNIIGTPMERGAQALGLIDKGARTKAIRTVKEFADYGGRILEQHGKSIRGTGRFYENLAKGRPLDSSVWMAGRENGDPVINGFRKFADWLGDKNSSWLEREDFAFFDPAFKKQFSRTMSARGLTVDMLEKNPKLKDEVIEVATEEALRATYRDESALAKAISGMKNPPKNAGPIRKSIAVALDAIFPFTKTPINIMRRAFDYSPIGFAKGNVNFWRGVAKKDQKLIVKGIDEFASSIPGTGIAALGFLWAKHDGLTGKLGDDDTSQFMKELGKQDFSVNFTLGEHNVNFTLDWAAPVCIPLFTGVAAYETARDNGFKDVDFWEVADLFEKILEPTTEMSVMRGFKDTLEAFKKNSNGGIWQGLAAVGLNTGLNYVNQIINPTLKGKVARTVDPIRRDTSSSADSPTKRIVEKWWNKQIANTPFLSEKLPAYQNVWAEDQKNTWSENTAGRIIENFVAPGYLKEYNPDSVDKKLLEILDKDPSAKGIIPEKNWRGEVSFKGGTVKLTKEEITQYNKMQNNKQEMKKLIDSADFKNKSLSEQEKAISNFNTDQKVKATRSILLKQGKDAYEVYTDSYDEGKKKHYQDAKNAGIPAKTYDEILHDAGADRSGNGRLTQAEAVLYLNKREDLTDPQRAIMFDYMADANNPYKDGTAYTKDWEAEYAKRENSNAKRNNTEDRKILEQAEKRDGGMASKLFNTSINKMSEQVAKEREKLGGSSSSGGGSKRGRSGRGGSGKSKTKAREKTASEKRFSALQTGKAPDIAKGIEGLNISGLSKSQRKALLKLMQKKLDV